MNSSLPFWQRVLGVRPDEARTVWLFFLHNFLLGIGTVLVYVAANVLLLENQPERNLPLAYMAAALAMLGAGRLYAYFEHHWLLQRLAVRVLLSVVVLCAVLGVLVRVEQSVAAAVAVVAGYRVIYLLTNLEFWGISAVVFDVRQGRRLFSVISSGDLPAKALGAVLALLIHGNTTLPWLLLLAFAAYIGALLALRVTLGREVVEARATARPLERATAVQGRLRNWFGDSRLVLSLCLSLLGIAAVSAGVEYAFMVHVKHRFHDQAALMRFVSTVLVVTYLAATVFKLLVSRLALDKIGVRGMLLALPVLVLGGLLLVGYQDAAGAGRGPLLAWFCGLYLGLEVLRRAVFDPVFLVLFQPLSPPERLAAHTRVKGVFEPLGMGLAGLLLFLQTRIPGLGEWLPFVWMTLLMTGALWFLHRTYGHYMGELHHALGRRFGADAADATTDADSALLADARRELPSAAAPEAAAIEAAIQALTDKAARPAAVACLLQAGPAAVPALTSALTGTAPELPAPEALTRRVAQVLGRIPGPASRAALVGLAQSADLSRREAALRALRNFSPELADAPLFQALVGEEMRRAQHLLHGRSPDRRRPPEPELALRARAGRAARIRPPRPALSPHAHCRCAARRSPRRPRTTGQCPRNPGQHRGPARVPGLAGTV
jgi:ATP/ADP translocase